MREHKAEVWAKWRGVVSEQGESGNSIAEFCRGRGLPVSQFFAWKRRLREVDAGQFVAVEVVQAEGPVQRAQAGGGVIEVRLSRGRSLVVEPGFDAGHLRALLVVLEA